MRLGVRATTSKISAMTGVNRKDATHILTKDGKPVYEGASIVARVLAMWENSKQFQDKGGNNPRPLTFEGEKSEFFALVRKVTHDFHPSAVLLELRRSNLIEEKGDTIFMVAREGYRPNNWEHGFQLLGKDISTLAKVVHENVIEPAEVRNPHIRTEFDNIPQSAIPELRKWILAETREFHRKVREHFAKLDLDTGTGEGQGGAKVVLTTFGEATGAKADPLK